MTLLLDQADVSTLKGVGPALATKLKRLGVITLADVLFHLPMRYEDRTRLTPIGRVQFGEQVVVEGKVVSCEVKYGGRRGRSLLALLRDDTGMIGLRFYHFSKAQQANLEQAGAIRCFGDVRRGAAGLEIYHPEYANASSSLSQTLTPVYPATEGVTQQRFRSMVEQVLALMKSGRVLQDLLTVKNRFLETSINDAIQYVHMPPPDADLESLLAGIHPAQQRLAFEELLAHNTSMRLLREEACRLNTWALSPAGDAVKALKQNFGFALTRSQQNVCREISADMMKQTPMLRLLQGDVGSGKTVVAAIASMHAVENGLQVAIMAPTEILAEQHFLNFSSWLSPLNITCAWLSGRVKGKRRDEQLSLMKSGTAQVVVGTHALFQKDVEFRRLGLVIIDEQHRFGVHQRLALREKGEVDGYLPHQLVMTATPIPRTLTMSMYADMDCSTIDELPPGRTPVTTSALPDARRDEIVARVEDACASGAQAYWVCTLIDESEVLQSQAAETTAMRLRKSLPNLNVGLVHGRMTPAEKTDVMTRFKKGEINLLVATTVIEVGVDVPNASLMIIENPERLGLAQLHQLRGRTGRGERQSFCVLLYHPPLGKNGRDRLNVLRESNDGFRIAEMDLELRGAGDVWGSRQSGEVMFRIANVVRDKNMLPEIRKLSETLLANNRDTAHAILRRWTTTAPERISQV